MVQQLPAIIVIAPLVISFFIFITGWWHKWIAYPLAVTAMSICLISSVAILNSVIAEGTISYWLGGWQPPWGIEYRIDHLNAVMLVLVSVLSLLATIHAKKSVERELPEKTTLFWSLFILMITGLLGICITGDLFNLYVTLELLGLSAVALASLGSRLAAVQAALRYLLVGLLGSMMFLAGVSLVYAGYGTLDLARLAHVVEPGPVAWTALALMTAGLLLKTALFPLHFWLPAAHASAPAPVSAVLSALVVKMAF